MLFFVKINDMINILIYNLGEFSYDILYCYVILLGE